MLEEVIYKSINKKVQVDKDNITKQVNKYVEILNIQMLFLCVWSKTLEN